MQHVVVIGAGQAGAFCVAKLRKDGFDGRVTLVGAEPVPPYQRPPLSKAYLLGDMTRERLFLRPESFYAEQDIELMLGAEVSRIDAGAKQVWVGDEVLSYSDLVLTTGSDPRRLPAAIGGALADRRGGLYRVGGGCRRRQAGASGDLGRNVRPDPTAGRGPRNL